MGPVENVIYVGTDNVPCYIAMSAGGDKQYFYNGAYHFEQCQLAERAKIMGRDVKIYGTYRSSGENNIINGIEYA